MPEVQRTAPAYVQIADHYRHLIANGKLVPGAKLPSITEMMEEWGVKSRATVSNALDRLKVERLIETSSQGTFVANGDVSVPTPGNRLQASLPDRAGSAEVIEVRAAETVQAPDYVAALLGLPRGQEIIRREEVSSLRGRPRMLKVSWIPASSTLVPLGALEKKPLEGGVDRFLASVTHRHVTHAQDHLRARRADAREAGALQVEVGDPIFAGVNIWSDESGPIVYEEWCIPEDHDVSYSYDVKPQES